MTTRIAFAGFRHGHIHALYKHAAEHPACQIVAAAEEDAATRAVLADSEIAITHHSIAGMLAEVECEVVAVGDAYGRRGAILTRALQSGRHVVSDKPICTRLDELAEIRRLVAATGLCVGCQFDLRGLGIYRTMRQLIRDGAIGRVLSVSFSGQHPLKYGGRPMWYFEDGMHGGTLNDIAIHGIDLIPWLTGLDYAGVIAARSWNAKVPQHPHFDDGGQCMLRLSNGAGVLADVSYFTPEGIGFTPPQYWRFTIHGDGGSLEADITSTHVALSPNGAPKPELVPAAASAPGFYLADFLADIRGEAADPQITTAAVLRAAEVSLQIQRAGHHGLRDLDLTPSA